MKTFDQCRAIIAQEYNFTTKLLMPPQYETMAAELYAKEKLKGLLEEVREIETDPINGYYSIYVSACNTIATRIEELITGSKCRFHGAVNYTNTRGVIMCGHCEKPIDHTPPAHETNETTKPNTP